LPYRLATPQQKDQTKRLIADWYRCTCNPRANAVDPGKQRALSHRRGSLSAVFTREILADDPVRGEPVSAPNSLLTGKNTGKFTKFGPSHRLHCLFVSVFRPFWPSFPKQSNRDFWARKQGSYYPEQGSHSAQSGPSPAQFTSANVKADRREEGGPMLGMALLPVAHPMPRAPRTFGR
jgi:hypothetical protein